MEGHDETGKLHGGFDRPYIAEDGEEFTKEQVLEDVDEAIRELKGRLLQAETFRAHVLAGNHPEDGEEYLSFRYVVPHGYDRTGPSFVSTKAGR